jgi:hypothetical protein
MGFLYPALPVEKGGNRRNKGAASGKFFGQQYL